MIFANDSYTSDLFSFVCHNRECISVVRVFCKFCLVMIIASISLLSMASNLSAMRSYQQMLRELTLGIYVHDTIPFFSLHFNADSNMYSVIHPAYQNTLVGRVISMLDYYMKGFLNGASFYEEFVQQWQTSKTQNPALLKSKLIDLHAYCQEHLGIEQHYYSIRELIDIFKEQQKQEKTSANHTVGSLAAEAAAVESVLFADYSGFRSSFSHHHQAKLNQKM